jgi:hypothetical protein
MGTNYVRVPTEAEMIERKQKLEERIAKLTLDAPMVANGFRTVQITANDWENADPWDEFNAGICTHLGKRSGGWQFCWNLNTNLYYTNKEELLAYIRSGRVVDEYGTEIPCEEFIEMALNWCPDGLIFDQAHEDKAAQENPNYHYWGPSSHDTIIDGLRFSSSDSFS